jgi:thymidylate kinase
MASAGCLDQYSEQRRTIEQAVIAAVEPATGKIDQINRLPHSVQDQLDPTSEVTRAAMMMAAIAYGGYPYLDDQFAGRGFSSLWQGTKVEGVAEKSEQVAREIRPEVNGSFVSCDLGILHSQFAERLRQGREEIVVTGLNGAGKSMAIGALERFVGCCGLAARVVKFPRYNETPLGPIIKAELSGDGSMPPDAFQYLAVADALQAQVSDSKALTIYDRHPMVDPLVYAPEKMVPVLLAGRELFDEAMWVYVIDRHPAAVAETIDRRGGNNRIFEKGLEQMADQVIRYATLTALPGCRWINNDIPGTEWGIELSKRRLVGAVITSGILDRAMVAHGVAGSLGEARQIQMQAFVRDAPGWLGKELS